VTSIVGIWYNGQSSLGQTVFLSMPTPDRLRIENQGETVELEAATLSISTRLGSTPRSIQIPDQGHVQCDDSEIFDLWFPRQSRIEKAVDWFERRKTAALSAAAFTVVSVVVFYFYGIPYAALKVAPHVSPVIESTMSEQVMKVLDLSHAHPSNLPIEKQHQLTAQFKSLIAGLPREKELHLLFRDAPGIGANAFALPNGNIVITDDLVKLAKNDEQLVSVMAHEVGHHEQRHAVRQTLESAGVLAIIAALLGDISGTSMTATLPAVLLQNGYSRDHEQEADDFAFQLLIKHGRSPQAFADMFKLIQADAKLDDSGAINYLSTHPASKERIARAEQAAKQIKK
jgi:Zn-dependent protease with chaperone function